MAAVVAAEDGEGGSFRGPGVVGEEGGEGGTLGRVLDDDDVLLADTFGDEPLELDHYPWCMSDKQHCVQSPRSLPV